MVKRVLLVIVGLVVLFLGYVATRPAAFRVQRSAAIAAPAEVVHAILNDFHRWSEWSPWEAMDPQMTRKHSGAPAGVGAVYEWAGNEKVGEGRMTIVDSTPPERVSIKLEFLKPWESTNQTEFTVTRNGESSQVTWAMSGQNGFAGKLFSVIGDMDGMVGADFEKGLAKLATVAQADAAKRQGEPAAAAAP